MDKIKNWYISLWLSSRQQQLFFNFFLFLGHCQLPVIGVDRKYRIVWVDPQVSLVVFIFNIRMLFVQKLLHVHVLLLPHHVLNRVSSVQLISHLLLHFISWKKLEFLKRLRALTFV